MDKPLWGLRVQKVHRVHKVQRVEVSASKLWKAPSYNKTLITALGALENRPASLRSCNGFPPCPLRGTSPAVRLVNQKEGPFMGRLRAYFDQLAHPRQDVHSGRITRAYCSATYERIALRSFIVPPLRGGKVVP